MRRFVYQLVERLADPEAALTRNRHFALLSSPSGRRALRLSRHLASLEQDFARFQDEARLSVRPDGELLEVRLEVPSRKFVRLARLNDDDLAFLGARAGPLRDALATLLADHR